MIGIMSDSHDNLDGIRKAVEFFNSKDTSIVLHAGDIISPFTVKEFRKLDCDFICVFGNNDGEKKTLNEKFSVMGTQLEDIISLEHGQLRICVYHGTYEEIVYALAESRRYDLVVRGHSHIAEISKIGATFLVNPGETCGYITGRKTVALLNSADMSAEIYEI